MKKYKVKLSSDAANALVSLIENVLMHEKADDVATKLSLCGMSEVLTLLKKKLIEYSTYYKMQLSPVQAHSMQLLYEYYVEPNGCMTGYLENYLRRIANEVHQKYLQP